VTALRKVPGIDGRTHVADAEALEFQRVRMTVCTVPAEDDEEVPLVGGSLVAVDCENCRNWVARWLVGAA
jgi:hypothetical protein